MNESINERTDETFHEQTNECTDGHRTQVTKDCEESLISLVLVQWVDMCRVARIFREGGGVSKWGYSPDSHVVFATCCRLFA